MFPHKKLDWLIDRLEKQVDERPDDPAAREELARAALSKGLYHGGGELWCNRALGVARKVISEDPTHVGALVVAGSALVALGREEAGRRYLDEALRIDPERADLHLALGALHRSEGDRHQAVRHLESACRLAPESWEPHLFLGRVLVERSRELSEGPGRLVERSQYHLVQALKLGPSQDLLPAILRDLGQSCLDTGRFSEAERLFLRLREHDKHKAVARYSLGLVAYHLGKYKNAIQHFRQYQEERPDDHRVHAHLAACALQIGEYDRAREHCERALLHDPNDMLARYTLGCAWLEEGNLTEAMRVFRETLQDHPEHQPSFLELARIRRLARDTRWLQQALEAEVGGYDRLPLATGPTTPRSVTRHRVGVLLEELRALGPSTLPVLLRAMDLVQDEGVRFELWEAACGLVTAAAADDVAVRLRDPGKHYAARLAGRAVACAPALPEPVLTSGLSVEESHLKRAAVDRYPATADVTVLRERVEKEREEARAWQALLLVAIATRQSRAGRKLLERWAGVDDVGSGADDDLATAARVGLAMFGDPGAVASLARRAHDRGTPSAVQGLLRHVVPPRGHAPPRPVGDDEEVHCSTCGRTAGEAAHLMAGTRAVICNTCVVTVGRKRAELGAPDDASCGFCGRTHLEARGLWRHNGVDICSHCLELSLGLLEREEVDAFLASW